MDFNLECKGKTSHEDVRGTSVKANPHSRFIIKSWLLLDQKGNKSTFFLFHQKNSSLVIWGGGYTEGENLERVLIHENKL